MRATHTFATHLLRRRDAPGAALSGRGCTLWGMTEALDGLWAMASSQEGLRRWVEAQGPLAPLAFFLVEVAQVIFSPLPGGLLPAAGAMAFGPWAALGLSLAGVASGSAVVFGLARRWGRPLVCRLLKPETVERYAGVLAARRGLWLCVVVAIPILPGDAVCAVAGLSALSFRRFMVASTLGRVPSTVLTIMLADELTTAPAWALPVVALAIGTVLAAGLVNRARVEGWVLALASEGVGRRQRRCWRLTRGVTWIRFSW